MPRMGIPKNTNPGQKLTKGNNTGFPNFPPLEVKFSLQSHNKEAIKVPRVNQWEEFR